MGKQEYQIERVGDDIIVTGGDRVGAMYGLLDLSEQIAIYGGLGEERALAGRIRAARGREVSDVCALGATAPAASVGERGVRFCGGAEVRGGRRGGGTAVVAGVERDVAGRLDRARG